MKTTGTCPKCMGRKIGLVERLEREDGTAMRVVDGRPIGPLVNHQLGDWGGAPVRAGHFNLHLCARCGYSEWYAEHFSELVHSPLHGVRLLDQEGAGPYR